MSNDSLKRIITQLNTGKTYPALNLVNSNPEIATVISKLIKSNDPIQVNVRDKATASNINQSQIQNISDSIKTRIRDNESIISLFPDIELAIQILVSSILSPKDMVKTEIIYKAKEPILPSELILKLNETLVDNFENYHKTKEKLTEILRDMLFTTGSYVTIVLPENIVDEVINGNRQISTESLNSLIRSQANSTSIVNVGILGKPGSANNKSAIERFAFNISTESLSSENKINVAFNDSTVNLGVEVTDNIQLLKLPKIADRSVSNAIKQINKKYIASEAADNKLSTYEFNAVAYKGNSSNTEMFIALPDSGNAKRKAIGRPLVMRLPSESVIPVYIPGDEKNHVGYFVLNDIDGNPINKNTNNSNDLNSGLAGLLQNGNQQNQGLSSMLISKARSNLSSNEKNPSVDHIAKIYSSIIENDLMERLRNGIYGKDLTIGYNEEIYRIMLARALANKYTRLLYIPKEYISYFAFKYHDNGVGKSYLDDVKILTSLRAILLFSKVMAQTKSSINVTHVGVTLDPNDPDPQKTIEMAAHEVVKMRQNYFPLGINTPADLVDWIQRAGLEFSFEGHPGLPQTKFDFETKNLQHIVPDSDLDELLRKQTYMAFGLTPEVIDQGFNVEFATTIVSNNILLSKRVLQLQIEFTTQLTEWCVKLMKHDTEARKQFLSILKENKGSVEKNLTEEEKQKLTENEIQFYNDLLDRYIDNIELDLPKPDETTVKNQTEAFDEYTEALDKALNFWISSEIITNDVSGNINSNVDSIKAVLKAHFIRQWMANNNFMSELSDIVTADEDGNPNLDIYNINKQHIESIGKSVLTFIKSLKPAKDATDKDLENLDVAAGSTDTSSDSGSSTDDSGTGGDDFGLGDLGDMGGMDDTTATDETQASTDESETPPEGNPGDEAGTTVET